MNFRRIKKNYDNNLWDKNMVRLAVEKGVITKGEYMLITSEPYDHIPDTILKGEKQNEQNTTI